MYFSIDGKKYHLLGSISSDKPRLDSPWSPWLDDRKISLPILLLLIIISHTRSDIHRVFVRCSEIFKTGWSTFPGPNISNRFDGTSYSIILFGCIYLDVIWISIGAYGCAKFTIYDC